METTSVICPGCLDNKIYAPPDGRRWYRYLLVTGSRSIIDYEFVSKCLMNAMEMLNFSQDDFVIVGGAKGVDYQVEIFCHINGFYFEKHFANWHIYGRSAGPIRNSEMVRRATQGIAIWDGKSKGTLDCMNKLREAGKLMKVYFYKQK